MTPGLPQNLADTVADEARALALVCPYPFDFYVSFFTSRFIPPRRDIASDMQHGIGPNGPYSFTSRSK